MFGKFDPIGISPVPAIKRGDHAAEPTNTPMTSVAVDEKSTFQPFMPRAVKTAVNIRIGMGFDMVIRSVDVKAFNPPFAGCAGEFALEGARDILIPRTINMMQQRDWIMACF